MKTALVVRLMSRLSFVVSLFTATLMAMAQADKYKPGDKIEYRESVYSEVWEPGVFMYATPDGKQPIIRKKPNEFYPEGSQTALAWDRIRPPGTKPAAKAPPETTTKPAPAPLPNPSAIPQPPVQPQAKKTAPPEKAPVTLPTTAGVLMTKEEVLNFLQARLGDQPFAHPQRTQILKELGEMIKRRGLNFRYENLSDFSNALGKYGASSEVTFPLRDNFGPPTKESWFMGHWSLSKVGATVDYDGRDGYIYRQTEIGVKDVGLVIINADGTYIWNIDVPRGVAKGTWRKAKPEDMPYQGGDAIVLQKAKGGVDWIVHQDRVTELKGDWVNIAQLDYRQIREGGFRTKGK